MTLLNWYFLFNNLSSTVATTVRVYARILPPNIIKLNFYYEYRHHRTARTASTAQQYRTAQSTTPQLSSSKASTRRSERDKQTGLARAKMSSNVYSICSLCSPNERKYRNLPGLHEYCDTRSVCLGFACTLLFRSDFLFRPYMRRRGCLWGPCGLACASRMRGPLCAIQSFEFCAILKCSS